MMIYQRPIAMFHKTNAGTVTNTFCYLSINTSKNTNELSQIKG